MSLNHIDTNVYFDIILSRCFSTDKNHVFCGKSEENGMSDRLDKLAALGCDIDGAMERFLEDEEFYFDCYDKVLVDPGFEALKAALEEHNIKEGFDYAHTLKGVLANLGMNSLYDIIVEIVESLRAGSDAGLMDKYDKLMTEREKYLEI